ncbi:hypothetical protein CH63R_09317 [Colletotrichum higginsianum IMI 349063]|uniref:Uncharacterized protein n=1 Tax=Colletotrichum higginsianum (strain IMI 349063) TaxID=759273 RepID=A0A1B7Y700_COLHI|nr:hypothetical protein CH63R_09317 [Colletotrichum higginsianum IMI 349063]OBR07796.1 hypothetical protein CH63R_09317 [Colletotrichum higginsianum IMI 349063]
MYGPALPCPAYLIFLSTQETFHTCDAQPVRNPDGMSSILTSPSTFKEETKALSSLRAAVIQFNAGRPASAHASTGEDRVPPAGRALMADGKREHTASRGEQTRHATHRPVVLISVL